MGRTRAREGPTPPPRATGPICLRIVSGDPGPFYARPGPSPPGWAESKHAEGLRTSYGTGKGVASERVIRPYAQSSENTDLPRTRANRGKKRSKSSRVLRACIAAHPTSSLSIKSGASLWRLFIRRFRSGASRTATGNGSSGSYKTWPEVLKCLEFLCLERLGVSRSGPRLFVTVRE